MSQWNSSCSKVCVCLAVCGRALSWIRTVPRAAVLNNLTKTSKCGTVGISIDGRVARHEINMGQTFFTFRTAHVHTAHFLFHFIKLSKCGFQAKHFAPQPANQQKTFNLKVKQSSRLRLQDFTHEGDKFVSHTHRPPLPPPQEVFLVLISVRSRVGRKDYVNDKFQ